MIDNHEPHPTRQSALWYGADNVVPLNDAFLVTDAEPERERRFGYQIGKFNFVLEESETTEILVDPPIYKIPNSPRWVYGLLNLRSNILPVVDIASYIHVVMTSAKGKFVLVIGKGSDALALLVDSLPKLLVQPQPQAVAYTNVAAAHLQDFLQPGVVAEATNWARLEVKSLLHHLKTYEHQQEPNLGE